MSGTKLSIIIVNWNSVDYLRKCLATIFANTNASDFEVIVVDNGPFDSAATILKSEFPSITVIDNPQNTGFARANNLGFKYSLGKHVLFLNPDTEILGSAISEMLRELDSHSDAGIVGCRLLNTDGTVQTSCIQRFPTILDQILGVECLRLRLPRLAFWGIGPLFDAGSKFAPVDVISGACLMIKRDVFEKVRFFSEDYFMYAEDVDLCYKVRKLGLGSYYVGNATIIHHGGGSTQRSTENQFAAVMQRRAMLRFYRNTRGRLYAAFYRTAIGITAACRLLILAPIIPARNRSLKAERFAPALGKWTAILRWAVGLEESRRAR